jgi:hypothetical protein
MGSVDIPPFLREKQKEAIQKQKSGDLPPFIKKKEEEGVGIVSSTPLETGASQSGAAQPQQPIGIVNQSFSTFDPYKLAKTDIKEVDKKSAEYVNAVSPNSTDPIKEFPQAKNVKESLARNQAIDFVVRSAVPDGVVAKQILQNPEIVNDVENETKKHLTAYAIDAAKRYDDVVEGLRSIKADDPMGQQNIAADLRNAAIKSYAKENPVFRKSLQTQGFDLNDEDLERKLPQAKVGQLFERYLNQPEVKLFLEKENPALAPAVDMAAQNLLKDNPEYAINQVANEISQERIKQGLGRSFNAYYGSDKEEATNKVAEELYKDNPEKLAIYNNTIRNNQRDYIDDPSLLGGVAGGIKSTLGSIGKLVQQPFVSNKEIAYDKMAEEANSISANPKGFLKYANDIGHLTGFLMTLPAIEATTGLGGTNALTLATSGDIIEEARAKYPDKPLQATVSAMMNGLMYRAMGKNIFPTAKIGEALGEVKPEMNKIVDNLFSKKITADEAREQAATLVSKGIDLVKGTVAKDVVISAELTGLKAVNQVFDKITMSDEEYKQAHPEGELEQDFVHNLLLNAPIAGLAKYGEIKNDDKIVSESIYQAASNPKQSLRDLEANSNISHNELNEAKSNLGHAVKVKTDLDAEGVPESRQKKFIIQSLREKVANQKAAQQTDSTLKKNQENIAEDANKAKEKILSGEGEREGDTLKVEVTDNTQPALLTPEQVEVKLTEQIPEDKKTDAVSFVNEMAQGEIIPTTFRDAAVSNPLTFLQTVADQALGYTRDSEGNRVKSKDAVDPNVASQYSETVVDYAKELFPEEVLPPPSEKVIPEDKNLMKDDKGEPITFYHGTSNKNITELEPSTAQQFGKGIYFGSSKDADAIKDFGDGGKIFEVHLPDNLINADKSEYHKIVNKVEEETGIDPASDKFPIEKVNDEIKKLGYKGIIMTNEMYGGKEAIVFDKKDVTYKQTEKQPPSSIVEGETESKPSTPSQTKTVGKGDEKAHAENIKTKFREQFSKKGIPSEQIDGALALMDARAKSWASEEKGRTSEQWYSRISDVKSGEFEDALSDIKYQGEWKKMLVAAAMSIQPLKEATITPKKEPLKFETVAEQKEVVAIRKFVKDYFAVNGEEVPKGVTERAIQLWEIYGKPKILPDSTAKDERAYTNVDMDIQDTDIPNVKTGYVKGITMGNVTGFDDFIAEISHAAQYKSGSELNQVEYRNEAERDRYEYNRKGSLEYDAHKLVEPYLAKYVLTGEKGDNLTISTLNTIPKKLMYELIPTLEKYKIKFQQNKGALETLKDGKVVIHALESPDFSTMVHEIGHVFEGDLTAAEQKVVKDFGGSEAFARGFERYLRDGKSPTPELKSLFDKFKDWLTNIYQSLKGSPIAKKVSPEVKQIFDRLLTEKPTTPSQEGGGAEKPRIKSTGTIATIEVPPPSRNEGGDFEVSGEETTGITHAQTETTRDRFQLPSYDKNPETVAEWDAEAAKLISEGYDIAGLLNKMENGHPPTAVEQRIMLKYIPTLEAKVEKNPSDENLAELHRAIKISDRIGGSEIGKSLVARKGNTYRDDSLASFFIREMEESQVDVLTPEQKTKVQKEYDDIKAANEALNQKIEALQEENSRLKAGEIISKERKRERKGRKTTEEFQQERKKISESIREKLAAARGETSATFIPYAKELIAISPDVAKLMRSYVEEGITKLGDVVDGIHDVLKDQIKDITKKDVLDLVAGVYVEPKKTKNELAATLRDLRTEADLINKLQKLEEGEVPITEKKVVKRNQEIAALRQQIQSHDLTKLADTKKRIEGQIEKVQSQLDKGDFATPEKKEPIKLDREGRELQDNLIKLKQEREVRILRDRYNSRSLKDKAIDKAIEIANVPRTLMASMDYSAPLRQAITATISHPIMAAKAAKEMFISSFSQKNFDRWFFDLKNDPRYDLMVASKLAITDPHSPFLSAKEEVFMNNMAEKIPIVGKLIKGSERAYVQYLNKMRVDLFNKYADRFEEQGKTFENSEELYTKMAGFINNMTGRGNIGKLEEYAPVLNTIFFSPRLIASRINLLNPYYFAKLPTELKKEYTKDMLKFIGLGLSVTSLIAMAGGGDDKDKIKVETDARSSDFMKLKQGNTRWDIWGGFQPYVRLVAQMLSGQTKSTNTGKIYNLDGEGAFGKDQVDVLKSFFRNKLAPVPAGALNVLSGRNSVGEKVTVGSQLKESLLPINYTGLKEAIKDQGTKAIFTVGIPSTFGISTQTYTPKKKK